MASRGRCAAPRGYSAAAPPGGTRGGWSLEDAAPQSHLRTSCCSPTSHTDIFTEEIQLVHLAPGSNRSPLLGFQLAAVLMRLWCSRLSSFRSFIPSVNPFHSSVSLLRLSRFFLLLAHSGPQCCPTKAFMPKDPLPPTDTPTNCYLMNKQRPLNWIHIPASERSEPWEEPVAAAQDHREAGFTPRRETAPPASLTEQERGLTRTYLPFFI